MQEGGGGGRRGRRDDVIPIPPALGTLADQVKGGGAAEAPAWQEECLFRDDVLVKQQQHCQHSLFPLGIRDSGRVLLQRVLHHHQDTAVATSPTS